MKSYELFDAIGDAREEYVYDAGYMEKVKMIPRKRFLQRCAALAAAFAGVLLLAIPVRGELENGYISNLLAPIYGNAQTQIVDQIGKPVNASVEVGDYILTADAVIGDKYNMAIVYSLTRADGGQVEKGLSFEQYHNTAKRGTWGGTYRFHLNENKTVLYIVEEWTAASRLWVNRKATASFTNLMFYREETKEKVLIEEGCWELKFTIRYEDASVKISAWDATIEDTSGKEYTIHRIWISPVGVHMDMTAPNRTKFYPPYELAYQDLRVSLILKDGRVITIEERNIASRGDMEDDRHDADFGAMFDEPIPLDQMKELVICGRSFPIVN